MFNLEEEIKKLKAEMERLKFEFNQFFVGNRKAPPFKERAEFERKLKELSKRKFFTHGPKFMIETLLASYNSYSSLWEKIMREIEGGRYVRGKGWAGKEPQPVQVKEEDSFSRVYEEYCELKSNLEGRTDTIDKTKFAKQLEETAKKLKTEKGCKDVKFRVVIENGKVKIKAIPVK